MAMTKSAKCPEGTSKTQIKKSEKGMDMINRYKNFRIKVMRFAFFIFHFVFLTCSHLTLTDLVREESKSKPFLFTADMTYQRNNFCPEEVVPPLTEKWQNEYESIANNGFTIFHNLLLFSDNKGKINFARIEDGKHIDSYKLKGIGANPPTIYQNIIYQSCETGKYGLIVYDLSTANILWTIKKNWSRSSPVVSEEKVFHQTIKGEIFCYNYYSGEEIWHTSLTDAVYNSLSLKDNILYCATLNGKIAAIENSSGIIIWEQNLDQSILANPVIHEDNLFITGYGGTIYLINLKTGNLIHKVKFNIPLYHGPAIDEQNIYLTFSNGKAIAISKKTLIQIWEYNGYGPTAGSPLITNSYLYYTTLANKLYILDKKDGKPVQIIELKGRARSTPIIHNDKLIIACETKNVLVFEKTSSMSQISQDK
jgi:outer membrane protein assembly factor BamB